MATSLVVCEPVNGTCELDTGVALCTAGAAVAYVAGAGV
jgi:hypothetical protein